jgi:hypothetical protein
MAKKVYFDTNAFREIGKGLGNVGLPADVREHVLVSPLSAFEVLSQLCTAEAEDVLGQIQAIHNWIDPERAGLLPWPNDALATLGFGIRAKEDDFTQRMQRVFNVCLRTDSAETLKEEACKLKEWLDRIKLKTAQDFGRMLEAARAESPTGDWFSGPWFNGIARRAGVDPNSRPIAEVEDTFSAYREFERVKLETALAVKNYKPEKHQNDLFDAEQLIYLGDPERCFLTCDGGFERVNRSSQAERIVIVTPDALSEHQSIEALLRKITQ